MIYLTLFGLALVCFSSIGSRSLQSFSRHLLEEFCLRSGTTDRLNQILKEYERVAVSASMFRLFSSAVVLVSGVFWLGPKLSKTLSVPLESSSAINEWGEWTLLLVLAVLTLLFVEVWLPRAISKLWGTHFVYHTWPLWRFLSLVLYPFDLADRFVNVFFHRLAGRTGETDEEEAFEEEIRTMVTEGHREGLLEEEAREMIEGVMELSDFTVSEIMTPRTDMISIPKTLDWNEMLRQVISIPHSRLPVYDSNRDDIIGVLHAKDLLRELAKPEPADRRPWTELMKEPLFVPETKAVDTLLQEFQNTRQTNGNDEENPQQRSKTHLAIVLDEYGGVSGIVTLEDILEEIVGEIVDEHDPVVETDDILEIDSDTFETLGKVRIDDLNETLGIELPDEEDYDTVAGFIFSTLGHVPGVGEVVDYEQEGKTIRFTVLEATRRRIEKIRVERLESH